MTRYAAGKHKRRRRTAQHEATFSGAFFVKNPWGKSITGHQQAPPATSATTSTPRHTSPPQPALPAIRPAQNQTPHTPPAARPSRPTIPGMIHAHGESLARAFPTLPQKPTQEASSSHSKSPANTTIHRRPTSTTATSTQPPAQPTPHHSHHQQASTQPATTSYPQQPPARQQTNAPAHTPAHIRQRMPARAARHTPENGSHTCVGTPVHLLRAAGARAQAFFRYEKFFCASPAEPKIKRGPEKSGRYLRWGRKKF